MTTVQLSGTDGNVFAIVGKVSKAITSADGSVKAKEFTDRAFGASSYAEVLRIVTEYVEVA